MGRGLGRAHGADLPHRCCNALLVLQCSLLHHHLAAPPHALGVSPTLLGPEGRWLCENHSCCYCKGNFYSFFPPSSAGKCKPGHLPDPFVKKHTVYFEWTLILNHTIVGAQKLRVHLLQEVLKKLLLYIKHKQRS